MNSDHRAAKRELVLAIFDSGALLTRDSDHPLVVTRDGERGFKMKLHDKNPEAPLSPVYLMLRTPDNPKAGPLTPEIVELAAHCMAQTLSYHAVDFDVIAGIPRAGEPFAAALGKILNRELIQLVKDESGGGRKIVSDGSKSGTKRVALPVDDLITGADTKFEAIDAMIEMGYSVSDLVVLVDREQGGREKLGERGIGLCAVMTFTELLDILVEAKRITPERRDEIKTYLAAAKS